MQDAIAAAANSPNKSSSSSNGGSQPVVQSDPATLPAPVQQTPPSIPVPEVKQEAKAPPAQQIALVPQPVKQQPGTHLIPSHLVLVILLPFTW